MRQRHTIDAWGTKLYFDCEGVGFDSGAAFAEITSFVGLVDDLFSTYKPDSVVSQLRDGRMQIGDAPVGIDHRERRARLIGGVNIGQDRSLLGLGQGFDLGEHIANTVIRIDTKARERRAMRLEDIREEDRNRMAEQDGIGDLHHGRLEV